MKPISPERYRELATELHERERVVATASCCTVCPGCGAQMHMVLSSTGLSSESSRGHANHCQLCGQFWMHMRVDSLPLPEITEEQRVWFNEYDVKGYI